MSDVWDRLVAEGRLDLLRFEQLGLFDREPLPSDGPDYHADHAAWQARQGRRFDVRN